MNRTLSFNTSGGRFVNPSRWLLSHIRILWGKSDKQVWMAKGEGIDPPLHTVHINVRVPLGNTIPSLNSPL